MKSSHLTTRAVLRGHDVNLFYERTNSTLTTVPVPYSRWGIPISYKELPRKVT